MMGSTKDPADGKAVAGSVFAAVVVYAVCSSSYNSPKLVFRKLTCHRCSSSSAAFKLSYMYGRVRRGLLRYDRWMCIGA